MRVITGNQTGQSLIEVVVGAAIATLIIGGAATALVVAMRSSKLATNSETAISLGEELRDGLKSVAEAEWQDLYNLSPKGAGNPYHLIESGSPPILVTASGTEDVVVSGITYTRSFITENVNRDSNGDIVEGSGTEDTSTQKVTVTVTWPSTGGTGQVQLVEYFTRWSKNAAVDFTDWSGSSGAEGPITSPDSNYSSATGLTLSTVGQITLSSGGATSGNLISSTFDTGFSGGIKLNSIFWQGSLGTGGTNSVKFQMASANCSNGATDPPTCTTSVGWGGSKTSGDGAFIGSDGTSTTYYGPVSPNTPSVIPTNQHNNKRYFRYKVFLEKDASSTTPVVQDAIINYSP